MLSQEAQKAIKIAHSIKLQQSDSLTPEDVQTIRADTDKNTSVAIPETITLRETSEAKGEWYQVKQNLNPDSVLLFIHGGAYMTGSVKSRRQLCFKLLSRMKCDGFSVDYRQWPEAKHPAGQEDVIQAFNFLKANYQHVYVFGESAGASLALTLTLQLKQEHHALPDRLAVFSPVITQVNNLASEYLRQERDPMLLGAGLPVPYFDHPTAFDPLISPIYGDYSGFPPMFITCGSEEVKFDNAEILNYLCQKAGVDVNWKIWQDLFHVFVLFDMPETEMALDEIANFLISK